MMPDQYNAGGPRPVRSDGAHNEKEQENEQPGITYYLRLFVSSSTPRSQQAINNIQEICEKNLKGQYQLEVIDVSQDPAKARENHILAVPTLLKDLPPPLRKIVGDLTEKEKVLKGLDIQPQDLK